MSSARKERLKQARKWYPEQHFTEDSHIISAYRRTFHVDRICAMRELCMLKMLPPKLQAEFEDQLEQRSQRLKGKRLEASDNESDQDDTFYFIAGYTSGGFPYGITWEEAAAIEQGNVERKTDDDDEDWSDIL